MGQDKLRPRRSVFSVSALQGLPTEFLPIPITSRLRLSLSRPTPVPIGHAILVFLSLYFSFFPYPALVSHMPRLHGSLIAKNRGPLSAELLPLLRSNKRRLGDETANEFNGHGAKSPLFQFPARE